MPDRRTTLLNTVNSIIASLQQVNGTYMGGAGDRPEDLSNEELELLIDQLQEKSNRPRHAIGAI